MVRIITPVVLAVVTLNLAGCGTGGAGKDNSPGKKDTTTPVPTKPTSPTTTTSDLDPRTPLYIVARLDTVALKKEVDHRSSSEVINWFLNNKRKLNLGVMTGGSVDDWPTNCETTKKQKGPCFDDTVVLLREAYAQGLVIGTGGERLLEICNNGYDTPSWLDQWDTFSPKETFQDWLEEDLTKSMSILKNAFPQASIMTLAVPANMADGGTLEKAKAHGLDIISTQSLMNCQNDVWEAGPPRYDYSVPPCDVSTSLGPAPQCLPEEDVWVTSNGFERVNGVLSVPVSAANALLPKTSTGISTTATIGLGDCECQSSQKPGDKTAQLTCSIVAAAKNNARKSNGLHWVTMLMDAQTDFSDCCGHNNYSKWLDDFYAAADALDEFNVKFIHFQDVPNLRPAPMEYTV